MIWNLEDVNFVLVPPHLELVRGLFYIALIGECVSDATRPCIEDQFVGFAVVVDVLCFESGRQICLEVIQLDYMDALPARGNSSGVFIDADWLTVIGQLQPFEVARAVCALFFPSQFLIVDLVDEWFMM